MDPAASNDAKAKETPLRTPAYRLHKPSGKAIVTLNGRMFYLGRFDSPESRVAYNRLLGEWEARGRTPPPVACAGGGITIKELLALYKAHAKDYYRNSPGTVANVNQAVKILEDTYPSLPAAEFGPRLLKALRATMIKNEWSRPLVNARIESIRRAFRWAVSEELLPAAVHEALRTVEGLRRGRSDAREPEPMQPVAWVHVEPVLAELTPTLRSMVELMWWTGMRTGELVTMKPQEIDRAGAVWLYKPPAHKNAWRGKGREIPMGPRAQEILKPFLDCVPAPSADKPVFSPQRSELERSLVRRLKRRNGVTPSQSKRRKLPFDEREEPPREGYDPNTFGLAVRRGIEAANGVTKRDAVLQALLPLVPEVARARFAERLVTLPNGVTKEQMERAIERGANWVKKLPKLGVLIDTKPLLKPAEDALAQLVKDKRLIPMWRPYALRHAAATRLRREAGLEAARVVLGHSTLQMTEHYAQIDHAKAVDVMGKLG